MAAMDIEQTKSPTVVPMEEDTTADPFTPAKAPSAASSSPADKETPPKSSPQSEADEVDSSESHGQELYYSLLKVLFKEMDLYAQPAEAGLLDPKKQILVYHHSARLFELKTDVVGALHGDFALMANLPKAYQQVTRKLRKSLQEQGQLETLGQLTEKHIFGHDHAIRFVESNLPASAKEHCVWLREKPHAQSDVVKSISPFRDVIKFQCSRNPLMLIEDHSMGLALTIEKTVPVAYLVVSPFLKKPEVMVRAAGKTWQHLEDDLMDDLINFIADESDEWRSFLQRRANIVMKGSLAIIQRALRLRPNKDGLDANALEKLQDLQEEVEVLREKARKADENAKKSLGKENDVLEGKLIRKEDKMINLQVLTEQLQADKLRISRELESALKAHEVLEERADIAEKSFKAQQQDQDNLRAQAAEAEDRRQSAVAERITAEKACNDANEAKLVMEQEAQKKSHEAELLAGGVHEMMVKLRSTEIAKRKAVQDAAAKAKAKEDEAKEAVAQAEKANERAAEAQRKETISMAELQLKTETLGRLTEANVNLRAEFAAAEERASMMEKAKAEACENATKAQESETAARNELQEKMKDIGSLQANLDTQEKLIVAAKAEVDFAVKDKTAAEQKMEQACKAQAEMVATLQVKTEEISTLTESCGKLNSEVTKLTQSLDVEREKVTEAQSSTKAVSAQLEVKTRTIETMTADSTALRVSLISAQDKAAKSAEIAASAEEAIAKAKSAEQKACEEEKNTRTELKRTFEEMTQLQEEMTKVRAEYDTLKRRAVDAEKIADEAKNREAETAARLALSEGLVTECAELRTQVQLAKDQAALAEERAKEEELAKVSAEASLRFKTDDVDRVCAVNVALRAEILTAQKSAEEATALVKTAKEEADAKVAEAHRARDAAQAELRCKVVAAESMAASIGAVRAETEKAKAAEASALEEAKKAKEAVAVAEEAVLRAKKTESQAVANLKVKSDEATRLTDECSTLRRDNALFNEKCEASGKVVKALAATCEKLNQDLAASQAKHDWSKLQEAVPNFSPPKQHDITVEDLELALAAPETGKDGATDETVAQVQATLGRRLRSKGPASRLHDTLPAEPAASSTATAATVSEAPTPAAAGARRERSKGPEPAAQKRARKSGAAEAATATPATEEVAIDAD